MKRLKIITLVLSLLMGAAHASVTDLYVIESSTWGQIMPAGWHGESNVDRIMLEPTSLFLDNDNLYLDYANWEYDITDFSSIESAFVEITSLSDHIQPQFRLRTYMGDGIITTSDMWNITIYTGQYFSLFPGSNVFDITAGLNLALLNRDSWFGVSAYIDEDFSSVILDSHAPLSVTGNKVPVPLSIWLLGSGLIALAGFRKKFKKWNIRIIKILNGE